MTRLIFTGGFLGAGKTTLLYEVTRLLKERGLTAGIITNDQAQDLADTIVLEHTGVNVLEVAGSCFCCDFKGLRNAIEKIGQGSKIDVILAEPVGSCTDLSATLINPIREIMKTEVVAGPLTVLVDPARIKPVLENDHSGLHPAAAYIVRKQLEEAEIIAITKTDLYSTTELNEVAASLAEKFPEVTIKRISSKSGEGLDKWLDSVLNKESTGGQILDIDYDRYAEGEAVLGWLNCSASLYGNNTDWDGFVSELMTKFAAAFADRKTAIGHVKTVVENGDLYVAANLTGSPDTLTFRWSAGSGDQAELIVNARVVMPPEDLQKLFTAILDEATGNKIKTRINRIRSISPGYPNPTHRYTNKTN